MLNRRAILNTLVLGCKERQFTLRVARPDQSVRTFWRQEPDEAAVKDPGLEVVVATKNSKYADKSGVFEFVDVCVANFNFRRQSGSQTSHGSAAARNMTRLLRSDEEVHRCVEQA